MKTHRGRYRGFRFPPEVIRYAVRLYDRFSLNFRDVEGLQTQREAVVSFETIRQWCEKFDPHYARKLRHRERRPGDICQLAELFVDVRAKRHQLWRAVDQDGDGIDIC